MRSKGVIYYIEKYFLILIKDKQYLKWFVCLIMCLYFNNIQAQDSHIIYGKVTDQNGNPVDFVSVAVEGTSIGTVTDESGNYRLKIPLSDSVKVLVSCMGYKKINKKINTKRGKTSRIDIKLETDYKQLDAVSVESDEERSSTLTRISSKDIELLPSASGSIETAIATQPGVSTRSELSSQYSVRGGNFDENLIYINDIRVYRPFLIRSGQQEGLSVINPDLVSDIKFSAGGFDASYGDKLSSVLDITYKEPTDYRGSLSASLLGGRVHFEGASGNKRLTHITGF